MPGKILYIHTMKIFSPSWVCLNIKSDLICVIFFRLQSSLWGSFTSDMPAYGRTRFLELCPLIDHQTALDPLNSGRHLLTNPLMSVSSRGNNHLTINAS